MKYCAVVAIAFFGIQCSVEDANSIQTSLKQHQQEVTLETGQSQSQDKGGEDTAPQADSSYTSEDSSPPIAEEQEQLVAASEEQQSGADIPMEELTSEEAVKLEEEVGAEEAEEVTPIGDNPVVVNPQPAPGALKIHFISGSKEYKSEESLTEYKKFLEENYKISVTASWVSDGATDLPEVDKIPGTDLLLIFTRRMKLPEEQMAIIRDHWDQGKPVVGLRTAGHGFQKEDNDLFGKEVVGLEYKGHGANNPLDVKNLISHPILEGVGTFSSLKMYNAGEIAPNATILQNGIDGNRVEPVTVVHEYNGGRMFFSSLGVPKDFKDANFRQMLLNAIFWTTKQNAEILKKQ